MDGLESPRRVVLAQDDVGGGSVECPRGLNSMRGSKQLLEVVRDLEDRPYHVFPMMRSGCGYRRRIHWAYEFLLLAGSAMRSRGYESTHSASWPIYDIPSCCPPSSEVMHFESSPPRTSNVLRRGKSLIPTPPSRWWPRHSPQEKPQHSYELRTLGPVGTDMCTV